MKLLFCKNCSDVKMLLPNRRRYCFCRLSYGRYLKNGKARYGGPAMLIAIDDSVVEGNLKAPVTDDTEMKLPFYRIKETAQTVEFVG